jgi:threonylcarbamoyladenosine tRNA methylthiotransferase MtaB
MAGFHIEHFGCRAARADGEAIAGSLRTMSEQQPLATDVVIVNTCSVTAEADRAARAFIRRAHRKNPAAKIVVTGCYAQRAPEELAAMAGVAAVVGNSHKALTPEIILNLTRESALTRGAGQKVSAASPVPKCEGPGAPAVVPVESLLAGAARAPVWADDRFAHSFIEDAHGVDGQLAPGVQTRPNLKIQEGCGNRCTFCVIPFTRGPSQSLPFAVVMRQVEGFVAVGGKELVLSGINLGRWGRDFADRNEALWFPTLSAERNGKDGARKICGTVGVGLVPRTLADPTLAARTETRRGWGTQLELAGLVRAILEQTGLPRLRLSSIEPMDWNSELIALMGEFGGTRLARHAHLPLQSGSDAVLRRMHRRYRPWHYAEKFDALLRAAGNDLTLGADVMAGFPGETDSEFEETLTFIRELPFGYLHLFPFSPRPGTRGWALHRASPVPRAVVDERMAALRALAAEKSEAHRRRFVGRELEAITLRTPTALAQRGCTAALTENFLPVELEGGFAANQLMRVRVKGLNADGALVSAPASAVPTPLFPPSRNELPGPSVPAV